jgi:hypothetical protein
MKYGAEQWKPRFNPWLIAAAVMLATFMEILDTSVANASRCRTSRAICRQPPKNRPGC